MYVRPYACFYFQRFAHGYAAGGSGAGVFYPACGLTPVPSPVITRAGAAGGKREKRTGEWHGVLRHGAFTGDVAAGDH